MIYESIEHADDTIVLKIESNSWEIKRILYHKTNREALTVLCSVLKHLRSASGFRPGVQILTGSNPLEHRKTKGSRSLKGVDRPVRLLPFACAFKSLT